MKLQKHDNRLLYYINAIAREFFPKQKQLKKILSSINQDQLEFFQERVNYYNKLDSPCSLGDQAIKLKDFKIPKHTRVYYFDCKEYTRYFDTNLLFDSIPGDVTIVPKTPAIVKSRPITIDNRSSVLLNMDKVRHFNFLNDSIPFEKKKDILIGRGKIYQEHRFRFYERYFEHEMCDLADVKKEADKWKGTYKTIKEHLDYKFILSLEGNDVATNLKWIMSSNSIAVMPKPKFETWFMEGKLIPNFHFIEIKEDYSDLEEKLRYYIENPEESKQIAKNANQHVAQFLDKKTEDIISILVLQKFFQMSGQL